MYTHKGMIFRHT